MSRVVNLCRCCGGSWTWNRRADVGPRCVAWGSAPMPAEATPGYVASVERERSRIPKGAQPEQVTL